MRIIALISGKGGSGKTSIALCMAKLLSGCGIKTLLVDCDNVTHGLSYFYEYKLEKEKNIITFNDLLCKNIENKNIMTISPYFHLIPSISNIKLIDMNENLDVSYFEEKLLKFNKSVVILDCQAGYSKILDSIISVSGAILTVLEADSISSSAIRVLNAQISEGLLNKKIYQIFNKVTQEEYDIYSKISSGTIYTNITPVLFNWKIRKDFALAQVPNLTDTGSAFGDNIYEICNVLLPQYKDELGYFDIQNRLLKLREKIYLNEKILQKNNSLYKIVTSSGLPFFLLTVPMIIFISLLYFFDYRFSINERIALIYIIVCFCFSIYNFIKIILRSHKYIKERARKKREMFFCKIELRKLEREENFRMTQHIANQERYL